jgi:PAS domain S-box-containing protein
MKETIQILLVEDNPGDARLIKEYLRDSSRIISVLNHVDSLQSGLAFLEQNAVDIVLVDLGLPDSQGLESLVKITSLVPQLPVIVLTGMNDSEIALKAMQAGAQDYLIKGDFTGDSIIRVIQYSIERKLGEAELQRSRQLLHEAERISQTGAWEWNLKTDQWTMSDEWMRIHGVSNRHYSTDDLIKIAHPEDIPAINQALKDAVSGKQAYDIEHRIIRQNDQEERIIQVYGKVTFDQEGRPEKLIGVAHDITERKETEIILQAQEDKFKRFFDTNPSATFVWKALDGDFVLTESNEASLEITSGKASNFLGLRASEIYADLPFMVEKLHACYQSKETIRFEHLYENRSHGTLDWVDFKMAFVEPDTVLLFAEIITERKEAEEEIRFQAHLLEAVEQAVIVTRLNGEIIYWNPFAAQLYGWPAEEVIGRKIVEVTVPQVSQKQGAEIMAKLGAGQSWSGEFNAQHRDGHTFPAFVSDTPIMNEQGELFAIIGISMDITERKQAEEALEESEQKYKNLVETASDAIYMMAEDGIIIDTNQCACDMLGKTKDEIIGSMIDTVDPNYPLEVFLEFWEGVPCDQQNIFETTHQHRDGHLIPIEISGKKYQLNGKTYYYGIARDITERKRAEDALRHSEASLKKAQEVANVGSWTWHIPTNELIWSNQLYKIFGINQKEFTGDLFELLNKITHPDDIKRINRIHQSIAETGKPIPYEVRIIRPDGTERTLYSEAGECIRNKQGNPQTISGITQDITERKQMELALQEERNLLAQRVNDRTAELRHTNAELMKALQTKDEFLANMSHELRTPLTAILGISEILELGVRGPLNEYQTNSIRTIYESGEHLLSLINDILDLSKIEAGKLEIEPGRVSVEDICQASYSIMKGMAFTKDIELSLHISDPEVVIWADARRLKQILVNLLSNAVKFTPHGGKVSLNVLLDEQQNQLKFIVKDNGIGISNKDIDKLFEPFTQLDASLSREYEGTGLGLALVRKLVALHQGEVIVESEGIPGKGSCFTVVLPWEHNPAPEYEPLPTSSKTISPDMKTPEEESMSGAEKQLIILLAEDNPANMTTMSEYLQTLGYKIVQAQNGMEAVEKASTDSPDLILMDIQMPEMDGLEAIRRLRQDQKFTHTPIFALTALAMPGDRQRCLDAGATDYITKPVKLKDLAQKIKNLS